MGSGGYCGGGCGVLGQSNVCSCLLLLLLVVLISLADRSSRSPRDAVADAVVDASVIKSIIIDLPSSSFLS